MEKGREEGIRHEKKALEARLARGAPALAEAAVLGDAGEARRGAGRGRFIEVRQARWWRKVRCCLPSADGA